MQSRLCYISVHLWPVLNKTAANPTPLVHGLSRRGAVPILSDTVWVWDRQAIEEIASDRMRLDGPDDDLCTDPTKQVWNRNHLHVELHLSRD